MSLKPSVETGDGIGTAGDCGKQFLEILKQEDDLRLPRADALSMTETMSLIHISRAPVEGSPS